MPHYLVELDQLRADCKRYALEQAAQVDQPDEDPEPEAPTEPPAPRSTTP